MQNLISDMLTVDPQIRLQLCTFERLKSHPFFDGVNWEALKERRPFKEVITCNRHQQSINCEYGIQRSDNTGTFTTSNFDSEMDKNSFLKEIVVEEGNFSHFGDDSNSPLPRLGKSDH